MVIALLRLVCASVPAIVLACTDCSVDSREPETKRPLPAGGPAEDARPAIAPAAVWSKLLQLDSVQQELAIDGHQKTRLLEIGPTLTAQARKEAERLDRQELSAKERHDVLLVFADQTRQEILEKILLPNQLHRLKQLSLQLYGVDSLRDGHIQRALGLSAEQADRIRKMAREADRQMREAIETEGDTSTISRRLIAVRKQYEKASLSTLTALQQTQFDEMLGPKFESDFPPAVRRALGAR